MKTKGKAKVGGRQNINKAQAVQTTEGGLRKQFCTWERETEEQRKNPRRKTKEGVKPQGKWGKEKLCSFGGSEKEKSR